MVISGRRQGGLLKDMRKRRFLGYNKKIFLLDNSPWRPYYINSDLYE
jgi:hypothetical protein